jgi:hypothetical protein
MRLISKTIAFFLIAFFVLVGMTNCKCGESDKKATGNDDSTVSKLAKAKKVDLARVIPVDVNLVFMSDSPRKLLQWIDSLDWWKDLKKTTLWSDLFVSETALELSTLRHKLNNLSPIPLPVFEPEKLLLNPMGLAVRSGDKAKVLCVWQIDLKVQALERLAEVFNQLRNDRRIMQTEYAGTTIRSIVLKDSTSVHYALYSNLLLLANDRQLLEDSISLATGSSQKSLAHDKEIQGLITADGRSDLVVLLRPRDLSHWLYKLIPLDLLAIHLRTGEKTNASLRGWVKNSTKLDGVESSLGLLPMSSRFIVAHNRMGLQKLWKQIAKYLPEERRSKLAELKKRLLPKSDGLMLLTMSDLRPKEGSLLPDTALLIRTKGKDQVVQAMKELLSLFHFEVLEKEGIWVSTGEQFRPSFALLDDWLVLGSSYHVVREIKRTAQGKNPSITDLKGFKENILSKKNLFEVVYVDVQNVMSDLDYYISTANNCGNSYVSESDIQTNLSPVLSSLAKIGKLGGSLSLEKGKLLGAMGPL